ncbi:lipid II:glycine glycyltransferase FemX [Chitinophaga defluvii]|uniref:Peptidoglycan bridge formation glycyltransferase FemA/FemB family protein n=1 Tax=Chitinophaga defluvii TaxID=3163343 RepID=A0ABV2T6U9_9BACT
MNVEVDKKEIKEVHKTAIIQQTAFWSEVKMKQGIQSSAFDFKVKNEDLFTGSTGGQYVAADLLILLQQIDDEHTIAYVPYGPEIEPARENQGLFLEELSESLRSYLPNKCIMIRYDLAWESHWAQDSDHYDFKGNWNGPPEKKYQEFRFNFNTQNWNLKKANSDILPSNTIFLNLKDDKGNLLEKMKPKTRYNINLSIRKGVVVRKTGLEDLDIWYELYKQTANRNRIHLNDIHYFRTVLTARANDSCSPAEVELLLAEVDGTPLAAMFLVISGNRGTYLYGASSSTNRNYMATYALQWEAITTAQMKGCTEYDFFGVAPRPDQNHPLYGLYKFKTGFGGELYHRMGCWDYPLHQEKYSYYIAAEMQNKGYHI